MKNCAGLRKFERHEPTISSSVGSEDDGFGFLTFPIEKVSQCCSLNFQCYKTHIFVGGSYLKYSRNVSQTHWIIDDERTGEASVEEIIGGQILPICQGDSYKFHAAGREDIDVRMLGTWRPFLIEIQNARQFPSDVLIKDIKIKINSLESKFSEKFTDTLLAICFCFPLIDYDSFPPINHNLVGSTVKCMQCSYCSNKLDPFLDLSLEIVRADSLLKALAHFTAKEQLDGGTKQYQCQQCKKKVEALKQLTLHIAPHMLTVTWF